MNVLKQSTAATIILGPFVDSADFISLETGVTISQADIRLSKNGAAFAQTNNAAGATHLENAHYSIPLDTTDTGTVGRLRVAVHESGCLPVWRDFTIIPAVQYDALVAGTDNFDVSVTQWTGTNVATPDTAGYPKVTVKVGTGTGEVNLSSGKAPATIAAGDLAASSITASALASDAVLEIADGVWDEATAGHVGAGSYGLLLGTAGDPQDLVDLIVTDVVPAVWSTTSFPTYSAIANSPASRLAATALSTDITSVVSALDGVTAALVIQTNSIDAVGDTADEILTNTPQLFVRGVTSGTPTVSSITCTGSELSAVDDTYVDMYLMPEGGGPAQRITAYDGDTKTFTTEPFATAIATATDIIVLGKNG